jgi:hypothetical protein
MRLSTTRPVHGCKPDKRFLVKSPSLVHLMYSPQLLCRNCRCKAEEDVKTELERIITRKADEIQSQIDELGLDWLEEKLQDAVETEAKLPEERQFSFGRLLTDALPQVRSERQLGSH